MTYQYQLFGCHNGTSTSAVQLLITDLRRCCAYDTDIMILDIEDIGTILVGKIHLVLRNERNFLIIVV